MTENAWRPYAARTFPSLALLELERIAQGYRAADLIVKQAPVTLLLVQPVCPGKVLVAFAGDEASVQASYASAYREFEPCRLDAFRIDGVHPELPAALAGSAKPPTLDSLGVIETNTAAAAVLAADRAAKAADIHLISIRLAEGMGGRGLVRLTGSLDAMQAALEAARRVENVLDTVLIPAPRANRRTFEQ
jgi:microcompartment protein CcmL/EutN